VSDANELLAATYRTCGLRTCSVVIKLVLTLYIPCLGLALLYLVIQHFLLSECLIKFSSCTVNVIIRLTRQCHIGVTGAWRWTLDQLCTVFTSHRTATACDNAWW